MQPYSENFIPVIPMENDLLHTPDQPICFDPTCSCHRNDELQNEFANVVYDFLLDGLLTVKEAEMLLEGRTV